MGNPCDLFNPQESLLAAFLMEMADISGGVNVSRASYDAIRYYAGLQGEPLPYSLRLQAMVKGLRRRLGHPCVQQDPFTKKQVPAMLRILSSERYNLMSERLMVMVE